MRNDLLRQYNLSNEVAMYHFQQNTVLTDYMQLEEMNFGLADGINDANDMKKWHTTIEFTLPHGDLPIYKQKHDDVGCTQAVIRSINEYLGGKPIEDLKEDEGADFRVLVNQLHNKNKIKFSAKEFYNDIYLVGRELKKGHPVAVTFLNGEVHHTVGINRIQIQQKTRDNKTPKTKAIIQVMDPEYSKYQDLSEVDFKKGTIRVTIPD